jgi:hypothetical protein
MKRLLVIAALVCGTAHADFKTGNELLSDMESTVGYTEGTVMGYVKGVIDAYGGLFLCPPATLTGGQSVAIVRLYLERNPSERHEGASVLIFRSMKQWPCKKSGSSL